MINVGSSQLLGLNNIFYRMGYGMKWKWHGRNYDYFFCACVCVWRTYFGVYSSTTPNAIANVMSLSHSRNQSELLLLLLLLFVILSFNENRKKERILPGPRSYSELVHCFRFHCDWTNRKCLCVRVLTERIKFDEAEKVVVLLADIENNKTITISKCVLCRWRTKCNVISSFLVVMISFRCRTYSIQMTWQFLLFGARVRRTPYATTTTHTRVWCGIFDQSFGKNIDYPSLVLSSLRSNSKSRKVTGTE